jgi:hypothetical protein
MNMWKTSTALIAGALALMPIACSTVVVDDHVGSSSTQLITVAQPSCATLWAGQNINAGSICVSTDQTNVYIDYATINGWELTEAHAWAGFDLNNMPQTNNGNPKIGLFPYKSGNITGATAYTFTIPLSTFGTEEQLCDKELLIAAHAAMQKDDGNGGWQTETGWGGDDTINPFGSWARYFGVTLNCEEPPPGEGECETAFAYGNTTFIDLGLTDSRWGWQLGPLTPGVYVTPIYAGAGQNDINKGVEVGTLTVDYSGTSVTVSYAMHPGYTLDETHLYVGTSNVGTIAPGQYGYTHDLTQATSDSFVVSGFNYEPIYVVGHGVACDGQYTPQ